MTEHGPQDEKLSDLAAKHGIKVRESERGFFDMTQPYEDDHGPQRQPASDAESLANMKSLTNRIRAFLAAEPDPDPQYMSSFIGEARILLRQAMEEIRQAVEEIERLRRLAEPVWLEENGDEG